MSSQATIPEGERKKANVARDANAAERVAGFKVGDKVKMKVIESLEDGSTRTSFRTFTISTAHDNGLRWVYQLSNSEGSLHEDGARFLETELKAA
ncbi:unnamed protein product [Alternaria alternata]